MREQARNKYRKLSMEVKEKKENMEEIDIKICLKKINKDWKTTKKIIVKEEKST